MLNCFMPTPRRFLLLSICLLCLGAFAPRAEARPESAWVLPRNTWYVHSRAGYGFSPSWSSFDNQQAFLFDSHLELGVIDAATLTLDVPAVTRRQSLTDDTETVLVNNGFTDLRVGTRVRLLEEPFALSLQGALKIPMAYDVSFSPSLGEGQLDAELGLTAGYMFYPLEAYVQGGVGYRLRSPFDSKHVRVSERLRSTEPAVLKPADEIAFFAETGIWLSEHWFASLNLWGGLALNQSEALPQDQVYFSPLLAYRINPALDVSLQTDVPVFNRNREDLMTVMLGLHLRFGEPLARGVGLRGANADYARYEN